MRPALPSVSIRAVRVEDVPTFHDHRTDATAAAMAAMPIPTRARTEAQWERIMGDPTVAARTILADGVVAGNLNLFGPATERQLGYWLGREFWGHGVATAAVARFLAEITERPLVAHVAEHNIGSMRVLEKNGFIRGGSEVADDGIVEIAFVLS